MSMAAIVARVRLSVHLQARAGGGLTCPSAGEPAGEVVAEAQRELDERVGRVAWPAVAKTLEPPM